MAKRSTSTRSAAEKKTTPRSKARKKSPAAAITSARAAWSGNIRLALVSLPVKIFPATKTGARIEFHQIHEPSGKRIRYQKVVPGIGPVDMDEIVKGFELEKGHYVLLEQDEIENLKLETKRTLDLVQFVKQGEIEPLWFDRPYYVVPDDNLAEEGYRVLRDALRASGKVGIGQFVMRGREHIATLKPCGNGLLLETLRFSDEVRSATPYFTASDDEEPEKELLSLAEELIERKTAPFEPREFKDQYTEAVRELIDAKAKKKKPVAVAEEEAPGGAEVIDLVEALKRSVKGGSKTGSAKRAPAKRKAG
ncbi:Ku domain containing protein [Parvibaculum lavamentivorans DS-1]|uniref:Non-homologous end joining protein Ku n=1 Tax=Parvibaculum lavamentivorans (strain DS-1 / DSM 13023 / NCIMB 13966) TaxID=402881 RepID=A7HXF2_PARL1|nr:Ku protein [Parvibaculum lavamentivorans]ABS64585.1 Ku domain containing protein [Parvibaculum lavamentivorans DS-1]